MATSVWFLLLPGMPQGSGCSVTFPPGPHPALFPSRPRYLPCVPVSDSVHPVPVR